MLSIENIGGVGGCTTHVLACLDLGRWSHLLFFLPFPARCCCLPLVADWRGCITVSSTQRGKTMFNIKWTVLHDSG